MSSRVWAVADHAGGSFKGAQLQTYWKGSWENLGTGGLASWVGLAWLLTNCADSSIRFPFWTCRVLDVKRGICTEWSLVFLSIPTSCDSVKEAGMIQTISIILTHVLICCYGKKKSPPSWSFRAGFLNCCSVDVWEKIILCRGDCPVPPVGHSAASLNYGCQ